MAGSSQPKSSSIPATTYDRPLRDLIPAIKEMIVSTSAGLKANIPLEQTTTGRAGGSYFMPDASGNRVAVFKPLDEERRAEQQQSEGPFVEGIPEGLKRGTKAGRSGYREAIAYLLDHPCSEAKGFAAVPRRSVSDEEKGFAGVPATTFGSCRSVYFKNPEGAVTDKLGSLQKYVVNVGDCKEIEADVYEKFPDEEVHKIAVLDMRFANVDRNGGNILRSESNSVLTPIDHGYCFPSKFGLDKFVWLRWPQAEKPFSKKTIAYVQTLNAQEDIDLLKRYGWDMDPPTARVFRVSTMLLQKGVQNDLMPYTIGRFMYSLRNKELSKIEKFFDKASEEADAKFIEVVSKDIDTLIRSKIPNAK